MCIISKIRNKYLKRPKELTDALKMLEDFEKRTLSNAIDIDVSDIPKENFTYPNSISFGTIEQIIDGDLDCDCIYIKFSPGSRLLLHKHSKFDEKVTVVYGLVADYYGKEYKQEETFSYKAGVAHGLENPSDFESLVKVEFYPKK